MIYFEFQNKKYMYLNKRIKIQIYNKVHSKFVLINKIIFPKNISEILFKVRRIIITKNKSLKFKRRKRYKRTFGYKNTYFVIEEVWQKKKQLVL
ncbi:hypothetical protein [Candidatus Vidania fulgoroideorum]